MNITALKPAKYATLLLGAALLTGCAADLTTGSDANKPTELIATGRAADYVDGDLDSRTTRLPGKVDDQWVLGFGWTIGSPYSDQVIVADPTESEITGLIDIKEVKEDGSATFSGKILRYGKDDYHVNMWHLGDRTLPESMPTTTTISIADQLGTAEALCRYDVMGDTREANRITLVGNQLRANFMLTSIMSFCRYTLDLPEGVVYGGEPITVSGSNLASTFDLNMLTGDVTPHVGDITIHGIRMDNGNVDIYMAICPNGSTDLTMSVTIDDLRYTGTFVAFDYQPDTYYTKSGTDGGGCTVTTNDPRLNGEWILTAHCAKGASSSSYKTVKDGFAPYWHAPVHAENCDGEHTRYEFKGWDTSAEAKTVVYAENERFLATQKDMHIYAVLQYKPITVTYNGPTAQHPEYETVATSSSPKDNESYTVTIKDIQDSWGIVIPEGKRLVGYDTNPAHNTVVYTVGQKLTLTDNLDLYMVFENAGPDHSKNPLLKWAESNLDPSKTSGFADNSWDKGQYYQWGNNKAWSSISDIQANYQLYCSSQIGTSSPSTVWGFNVYKGHSKNYATPLGSGDTYIFTGDKTNALPAYNKFLIADSDLKGCGGSDWWPARRTYGDNWTQRAIAGGWTRDAAPEGWHIATSAEYAEIMPSNKSASSSATFINSLEAGEIRTNADCTYAIKWTVAYKTVSSQKRYVLQVFALVVEPGTKISAVDWNDKNRIIRTFPCAGYVCPSYNIHTLNGTSSQRVCYPKMSGVLSSQVIANGTASFIYEYLYSDYSNFRTAYWTADGDSYMLYYDTNNATYQFTKNLSSITKCHGLQVRCVKD